MLNSLYKKTVSCNEFRKVLFLIRVFCAFSLSVCSLLVVASSADSKTFLSADVKNADAKSVGFKNKDPLNEVTLKVRDYFPQYRVRFHKQKIQKEVDEELLQQQEEQTKKEEQSNTQSNKESKPKK